MVLVKAMNKPHSVRNILSVGESQALSRSFMVNLFPQCFSVNKDQIKHARNCQIQPVPEGRVYSTDTIQMYDKERQRIAYFNVRTPPKSKIKTGPDVKRILSGGKWGSIPRGKKKKRKVLGGSRSNTQDNFGKLIQRRKSNAPSIGNLDSELVPEKERKQRTCSFCGQPGHIIQNCISFASNDQPIVKDIDRPEGNYAFLDFDLDSLDPKFEQYKEHLQKPPVDLVNLASDRLEVCEDQTDPTLNHSQVDDDAKNDVLLPEENLNDDAPSFEYDGDRFLIESYNPAVP